MNRRSVLQALGVGAVAGRGAAQQALQSIPGLSLGGSPHLGGQSEKAQPNPVGGSILKHTPFWKRAQRAIANRLLKDQIESSAYYYNRHVGYIDPDIAGMRSFSLAAKIVYQRQRNVQRDLEGFFTNPDTRKDPHSLIWEATKDWL